MERQAPRLVKYEDFNDITEELFKTVRPLTGPVTYRFVGGVVEHDPENIKYNGKLIWPALKGVPTKDKILDKDGSIKEIGVFDYYDKNTGHIKTHLYQVRANMTNGTFTIDPNNVEQLKFYTYFELCDFNGSKEGRDESKPIIFERVDEVKSAKNTNKRRKALAESLYFVEKASKEELELLCDALQWGTSEPDVMRANLGEYAEQNPEEFLKIAGNKKDLEIKATIKQAMVAGVLGYDKLQNKATMAKSGEVIATFEKSDTRDFADMLCEYINTNTKGATVLANIKKLLKATKELA